MTQDEIDMKVANIFYQRNFEEVERLKAGGINFVHYTTADAALSIIRNNCVWLRNSLLMNDYSEVQHGLRCLDFAWRTEHGERLCNLMERFEKGMSDKFAASFDGDRLELMHETYLLSISEHGDAVEDKYGRLSMWRAYGSTASVALVFDQHPFVTPSDALQAYTTPVFYGDPEDYASEFRKLVERMEADAEFLISIGNPTWFFDTLMDVFRFSVLSTKHPGFREEREWRVIFHPVRNEGAKVVKDNVTINGTPQRIYKIPFVNYPDEGFTGATLPESLRKVILGPMTSPYPTYQTFNDALVEAGVTDLATKLACSFVPLRN